MLLFLLLTVVAIAIAAYSYLFREPPGRGRALLAALRAATLMLIILLLIDPRLNAGATDRASGRRVVLDASLSMQLPGGDSSAWRQAAAAARAAANGSPILLAGETPRRITPESLSVLVPSAAESRMLPALQAAAEAGAHEVVLITDGGVQDLPEIARWLPRLGIELETRQVGGTQRANRAIAEVVAPPWAESGKPLELRVGVAATASRSDSLATIVVRQGSTVLGRQQLALPRAGRIATATLSFPATGPAAGGLVRYDVAFADNDAVPDDDVRSVYVFVSERPAGVAIVSFAPDWEPRFLQRVLEQALGLPVRTFLRLPTGAYIQGGSGLEAGRRVTEEIVRRAVASADLLVVHGAGAAAPSWADQAAQSARRAILFPAGALSLPIATTSAVQADWYVAAEVPPSPVAPLLSGAQLEQLPPLYALRPIDTPPNAWAPLLAGRTRRGGQSPVALAGETAGRRWVVALGEGYWRWAFRGGAARDVYARFWGALAGWLVQDDAQVAGAAIRPVRRVVQRGQPLRWVAPGLAPDSLSLRVTDARGAQLLNETIAMQQGDTAVSAPLPPGQYRYQVRAFGDNRELARAEGPLTAESYSREFLLDPVDLSTLASAPRSLAGNNRRTGGRPLHATAWPYALLVLLLCAEWILRRRWGLR